MAKSSRDRVSEVMDALKEGLAPFVVSEFARRYNTRVLDGINAALTSGVYGGLVALTAESAVRELDTQGCLNLITRRWEQVFKNKLGKSKRRYVGILSEIRNE